MPRFRSLLLGVTILGLGAGRAGGQTTYDACYVPSVGAIYLIKLPGLPTACLAQTHMPVSWTDGAAPADGSITAVKLADGAVVTIKLADGAVTPAKLSFNPATQAELDAVTGGLAAAGTINTSTNPVDWTQLKNVPAGFADGVDASGGISDHGALTGLTDDDHPQYLLADGTRNVTNGLAVTGTFGTGVIPAAGGGVRLMWYPGKGAFRAGAAIGTAWNDANVGAYSVAMGGSPIASGAYSTALGTAAVARGAYATAIGGATSANGDSSTALGTGTTASGVASTAMGRGTTAAGVGSTAMGYNTTANVIYSTAMGVGTAASGTAATALGWYTNAAGPYSTAMGWGTHGDGDYSTAMGYGSSATTSYATALGHNTTASGWASTAMGDGTAATNIYTTATGFSTSATGYYTTAMGAHTIAQSWGSVVIGDYNVIAGNGTSRISTDPLFVAGNGTGTSARSNALTLLRNGDMTIAGTLTQSSDLRLKEAVEPLGAALDGVLRLRPIRFRFREGTGHPTDPRIGLGAQDVDRVFPELVRRDAQGYLSVAYTDLAAVLVRAVQEQQATIEALRAEVIALRAVMAEPARR